MIAFVWFFPTVYFQMSPQTTWIRGCIVTLAAFVWLFFTVYIQMSPQTVCPRRCKVTLIAFVWLFSTVYFQMWPQSTWIRACIVTLVAFVWLLSTVCLKMFPQTVCPRRCKVTLVAFVWLFLQTKVMIFKILFHCHCALWFGQMVVSNWSTSSKSKQILWHNFTLFCKKRQRQRVKVRPGKEGKKAAF